MVSTRRSPLSRALGIALALSSVVAAAPLALPGAASADNGPNAVFRNGPSSRLPDCRAYEKVTPLYKEGFPVFEYGLTLRASPLSGEGSGATRVEGDSLGAFAGVEDDHVEIGTFVSYATYVFTRGGSGWTTTAISLSASQFPRAISFFSSSDLSRSLWAAATTAQVDTAEAEAADFPLESFYARSLNGPAVAVGPILPPSVKAPSEIHEGDVYYEFEGASGDASVLLYSLSVGHWRDDETAAAPRSLYEYVRTGNSAPLLVKSAAGRAAGPGQQVRDVAEPAGQLGSGVSGVSEDGETVYFAAAECGGSKAVQELYARVDNEARCAYGRGL